MPNVQRPSPQPGRSNYLDFELEIGAGRGREYPVTVLHSPAGEARGTLRFPFDELALENRLLNLQNALLRSGGRPRRTLSPQEKAVQEFGRDLFRALFDAEIRSCYDVSRREARQQRKGLRLKLRIQSPELAALPWEYLYHPAQAEYLSLSTQTPIVRYLELPHRVQPLAVRPPLRILGLVASPHDERELDVGREKDRVERATRDLRRRGLMELEWLPGQTWRDLQRAMRRGPWHIFHFVGHGGFDRNRGEGLVVLADRQGRAAYFNATRLARLLGDHTSLRLALLNSCEGATGSERDIFSSVAASLVRRAIPAVVAMQYEITDGAAIEFAQTFYESLGDGLPVDGAVAEARKAISLAVANTVEWGTPVLYMRAPDGVLFELAETPPDRPLPPVGAAKELERLYLDGLEAQAIGDRDKARRCFQEVVKIRPDYEDAAARLQAMERAERERRAAERKRQATLEDLYRRAVLAVGGGEWAEARRLLVQVQRRQPGYRQTERLLARANAKAPPPPGQVRAFGGVEMVYVPAGKFWMGSKDDDSDARDDEKPRHEVQVDGFWIDRTPVTNQEYRRFVEATGHPSPSHWQKGQIPKGKESHPVVKVSWHDAQDYCRWRSEGTGVKIRLPTEAEWEKAARGAEGRIYPWGKWPADENRCNFGRNVGGTTPVGHYSPAGDSPYGLVDMAGNVWEWVADWFAEDYYANSPENNPKGPDPGDFKVLRGGGWVYGWIYVRAAYRYYGNPSGRNNYFGFRCAAGSPGE